MLQEFKEFLARGNVIDLAVGVVLGMAFNQVVNSLVEDIFTPLIGIALGRIDFSQLMVKLGEAEVRYGNFIQMVITFLITAFALFLLVKVYNRFRRKEDQKEEIKKEVQPSQEVVLLTQIRDAVTKNPPPQSQAARQPAD